MPYNGEFHFTALRTLGTVRTMSASSQRPTSRFQPGMPAMYACTGASPSPFAICGLPPDSSRNGLASLAPGLALVTVFADGLDFVAALRGLRARDLPFDFLSDFLSDFAGDMVPRVYRRRVLDNP